MTLVVVECLSPDCLSPVPNPASTALGGASVVGPTLHTTADTASTPLLTLLFILAYSHKWVKSKSEGWRPHGCLVGRYKAFDEKICTLA